MNRKVLTAIVVCLAVILALLLVAALLLPQGAQPAVPTQITTSPTTEATQTPTRETTEATTAPTTAPTEATTLPVIPEIKPETVGLYIPAEDGTKARKLVSVFEGKRVAKRDIDCFEALATQEAYVSGSSFTGIWKQAWEEAGAAQDSKIGYMIEFALADGQTVKQTIRKPSDAKWFYDYLEIYLYDDIHQKGWYSHLEDENITAQTVISSIKLTAGSKIDQVGDILLTAFIYQGDDCFDAEGRYIGDVLYTVSLPG